MNLTNHPSLTVADFWARVCKTDACWEWLGPGNGKGYGKAGRRYAHRWSWEIHFGPVPSGMFVLHRCDYRGCVRPDHLFLGTQGDNMRDMVAKGRHVAQVSPEKLPRGEKSARARLTTEKVIEIRRRFAAGETITSLARAFDVWDFSIRLVVTRRSWRHVPEAA